MVRRGAGGGEKGKKRARDEGEGEQGEDRRVERSKR